MHRRSTRRQASSIDQGRQQKRVDSDSTTSGGGQQVKQKRCPRTGCVRAGDDVSSSSAVVARCMHALQCFSMASAQSAPKMCVTCEHAPTRPHARSATAKAGMKIIRGVGLPEGQRNSREAENTDDAKEHRGAKHKTIA